MKVTLDLTRLLHEGRITQEEHDRFSRLAHADTGSLAFNILVGLGVVAVAGAALALVQTAATAIVIGGLLMGFGLVLLLQQPAWGLLANICILLAALMFGGGILVLAKGSLGALLGVVALLLVCGVVARSGLLVGLAMTGIAAAVGSGTNYWHASYELSVEQPTLTILVFAGLSLLAFVASKRLPPDYERLAIIAARVGVFYVNFGFWIGSLFGDPLTWLRATPVGGDASVEPQAFMPSNAFAIAWAVALIAAGVWAARENRRWVVNVVTVFGAIHFYTQWFEHLSATPLSILIAGLATLGLAVGLFMWNQHATPPQPISAAR